LARLQALAKLELLARVKSLRVSKIRGFEWGRERGGEEGSGKSLKGGISKSGNL